MALSVSGVLTLAFVLLAGPLVWLVRRLLAKGGDRTKPEIKGPFDDDARKPLESEVQSGEDDDKVEELKVAMTPKQAEDDREEMDNISYAMALIGYAIGIGNIWRFPYLCGKFGGMAFVVAYVCSFFFVAMPLYLMEMGMGQYTRKSVLDCYRMIHPRWVGLGIGQAIMLFCVISYFNVLLGYASVYVGASLLDPLPWSATEEFHESAAEKYWRHDVLNKYSSLDGMGLGDVGGVQPKLVAGLLSVWIIVFFALAFGKEVLAKVTWVTVIGPIVLLLLLLVQAVQLEGAGDGIQFYICKFEVEKLASLEVWATACSQIVFSLSPGFGTAITMTSYTKPNQDVFKTCVLVSLANSAFSLTGGVAIFSILGNVAFRTGKDVVDVASASGPGLAFIAIADGMRTFGSLANLMSVLFFMMLLALGLDSTFAWVETFVSIIDDYCRARGRSTPKTLIVGGACAVFFVCGLPFCTRMGSELLDVVDHFVGSIFLLLGCFVEVLLFNLDFNFQRLAHSIKKATLGNPGFPDGRDVSPEIYWRICYYVTAPLATGSLCSVLLYKVIKVPYEDYPFTVTLVGWVLLAACVIALVATLPKSGASELLPLPQLDLSDSESESTDASHDEDSHSSS
eukprot:TRINITY_DN10948_c0_g1_i1.p1 TRINITY_DN10948_c0_g1~~TRINITY_DN10948_c0_g1_i1.p1  ORF type:complete len:658 (-),score=60.11 TRINITY_DN10948_c0_g1_i1:529-2400(-)